MNEMTSIYRYSHKNNSKQGQTHKQLEIDWGPIQMPFHTSKDYNIRDK